MGFASVIISCIPVYEFHLYIDTDKNDKTVDIKGVHYNHLNWRTYNIKERLIFISIYATVSIILLYLFMKEVKYEFRQKVKEENPTKLKYTYAKNNTGIKFRCCRKYCGCWTNCCKSSKTMRSILERDGYII